MATYCVVTNCIFITDIHNIGAFIHIYTLTSISRKAISAHTLEGAERVFTRCIFMAIKFTGDTFIEI